MKEKIHYIVKVKEHNNPHVVETEYIGNLDKRGVIDFYGLERPEVEGYMIQIAGTPLVYGHNKAML